MTAYQIGGGRLVLGQFVGPSEMPQGEDSFVQNQCSYMKVSKKSQIILPGGL